MTILDELVQDKLAIGYRQGWQEALMAAKARITDPEALIELEALSKNHKAI